MKTVIIDGYTTNPGDLSWEGFSKFGEYLVYDRTEETENDQLLFERIKDADAIVVNKNKISKELMRKCKSLKYIGECATGYDNIDIKGAIELGIAVTNVPKYSTEAVAQHTIALLLEATNHVAIHSIAVKNGEWKESKEFFFSKKPLMLLSGKSIGIVGYGAIGKKVANICGALGMVVNVYSKDPKLAISSDIVSLHCPLNDDTKGFVDGSLIREMKDGVIILNTARGALVDETAIAAGLQSKKIGAYCTDVMISEPPETSNPLIGLDNFIVTPHIAWIPRETREYLIGATVDNLKSFLSGGKKNRVDIT